MKYFVRFTIFSCMIFIMFSCQPESVHQSSYHFKHDTWNSFEKAGFRFMVENTRGEYDLYLNIVYTNQYPREYITFATQMITPGGEERLRNFHLRLRTKDEVYTAYENVEIIKKKILLIKDYTFEKKGNCIIRLDNRMSKVETAGVRRIELEVIRH